MPSRTTRSAIASLAVAIVTCAGSVAVAETIAFKATLNAATEIPPNDSKGAGTVTATYDSASKKLSWKVDYTGLSGPATAAHFHGSTPPSPPAANGTVTLPTPVAASPFEGSATLTDEQAADLLASRWYYNIHTAANRGGEIRGQVTK